MHESPPQLARRSYPCATLAAEVICLARIYINLLVLLKLINHFNYCSNASHIWFDNSTQKSPPPFGVYWLIIHPFVREAPADTIMACQDLHESPSATGYWYDSSLTRHHRCIMLPLAGLLGDLPFVNTIVPCMIPLLPQHKSHDNQPVN
jgi:hypothetical protein